MLPLADVLVHVYVPVDDTILQRGSRIRATAPRMRRPLSCRAAAVPGHRNGRTSVIWILWLIHAEFLQHPVRPECFLKRRKIWSP